MMANKEIHSSLNPLFMLKHVEVSDDLLGDDSDSGQSQLSWVCGASTKLESFTP